MPLVLELMLLLLAVVVDVMLKVVFVTCLTI